MPRRVDGPEITGQVFHKQTGQAYGPVTVTASPKVYTDPEMSVSVTSLTTDGTGVFSCYAPPGQYTFTTTAVDAATIEPVEVLGHEGGTGTPQSAAYLALDGTSPKATLRTPSSSEYAATGRHDGLVLDGPRNFRPNVPDNSGVSLLYADIGNVSPNRNTGSSLYGIFLRTLANRIDNGAAIAIQNAGAADSIYLGVQGFTGSSAPNGDNAPSGIGIDINRTDGATTESSSTFKGFAIQAYDYSTTDQGISGPVAFYFRKGGSGFGNPDTAHPMLNLRGNRRVIRIEVDPTSAGYDGTFPVFEITTTGDSRAGTDGNKVLSARADGTLLVGPGFGVALNAVYTNQLMVCRSSIDSGTIRFTNGARLDLLSLASTMVNAQPQQDTSRGIDIKRFSGTYSVDMFRAVDSDGTSVLSRVDKAGRLGTRVTAAPVLADMADGDLALSVDASGNPVFTSRVAGAVRTGYASVNQITSPETVKSGAYTLLGGQVNLGTGVYGNGIVRIRPYYFPKRVTLTRIGCEVTGAGDAGSTVRLGIWADDGTGYPGALVYDVGASGSASTILNNGFVAGDSVGVQEVTVNVSLDPGVYWITAVPQSVTVTGPTLRNFTGNMPFSPSFSTLPAAGQNPSSYAGTITGAFGAFPAFAGSTGGGVPRIHVKVA